MPDTATIAWDKALRAHDKDIPVYDEKATQILEGLQSKYKLRSDRPQALTPTMEPDLWLRAQWVWCCLLKADFVKKRDMQAARDAEAKRQADLLVVAEKRREKALKTAGAQKLAVGDPTGGVKQPPQAATPPTPPLEEDVDLSTG